MAADIRKEILQPIPPHHLPMVWRMGSAAMEILFFISAIGQEELLKASHNFTKYHHKSNSL
jgi:hypothetical protein